MKNLILLAALFLSLNAFAVDRNPTVSDKVLKTFNQLFTDAQDVRWSSIGKYTEASFKNGDVKTRAFLDQKGSLVKTIRYYNEEGLPFDVLYKVKKAYARHDIWGVVEVSDCKATSYRITLKDQKNWYQVEVDAQGDLMLHKKYKRADA